MDKPTLKGLIAGIRKRCNEATPGPWGLDDPDNAHCMITRGRDGEGAYLYVADVYAEEDMPLIIHARPDLEVLASIVEELDHQVSGFCDDCDESVRENLRARVLALIPQEIKA